MCANLLSSDNMLKKDYALQIRKLRAALGITQHALAERLRVQSQVVSSWEQGRREPSATSYQLLAWLAAPEQAWFFLGKIGVTKQLVEAKWPQKLRAPSKKERPASSATSIPPSAEERGNSQVQIPVLRDDAVPGAAGEIREQDIESFLVVPDKFLPKQPAAYIGIYQRGNAMREDLPDGFIAVVDRTNRSIEELIGRMVGVVVQDRVLVRWLGEESRPDQLILRPGNPQEKNIILILPESNPILGDVVFWWGLPEPGPAEEPAGSDAGPQNA